MSTSLPARFPLTYNDSTNTLRQIHDVTNNFSGINPLYIGNMTETIYKRQKTWVGTLEAPEDTVLVKQIIGKNGLHLKNFTNKCCVDLIWHDRGTNRFMVWGNKKNVILALHFIKRQIHIFTTKKREEEKSMEEMMSTINSLEVSSTLSRAREEDTMMGEPDRKRTKYVHE